jgi:septal ring factor EnvC (AmiA/AmiB activator)
VTNEQLQARVAELEREVARLRMLNERIAHDEALVQMANEDMRAKLDAVPVQEIRAVVGASVTPMGYMVERNVIAAWLSAQEVGE